MPMKSGGIAIESLSTGRSALVRLGGRRIIAVGLVAVFAVGLAARVEAQDPHAAKTEYDQLLEEEKERRETQVEADAKAVELAEQVSKLDARIVEVQAQLEAAEATLAAQDAEVVAAEARVEEAQQVLDREEQRLRDQSVAAYMGGGSAPVPDLAVALDDPKSIDDIAKSRVYASVVVDNRRQVVARFAQARENLEIERGRAAEVRQASQQTRDEVAATRDELGIQRDSRAAAQQEAETAAQVSAWLAAESEERRREAEVRFAAQVVSSDSIRDLLAARQRDQVPAANTFGILLNPIRNGVVVSEYGMRLHPILGYERMHFGLDIDGHMGDPMRASEAGVVVIAAEQGGYGNTIVIDHGNTISTLYGHMAELHVRPGDVVTRGQVIGLVGSTGRSTGPHCHWEVRVMGLPVDGTPYLDTTPEP